MSTVGSCSIEGCAKRSRARGWCQMHYTRWLRHGDPLATARRSAYERVMEKVEWRGECLVFTGNTHPAGYGLIWVKDRFRGAHRIVAEHHLGGIPSGLVVRHSCDNPPCVNPEHLSLGTARDNSRDMVERGRSVRPDNTREACIHGHPFTPENTIWLPAANGLQKMTCRECSYRRARESYLRRKHERVLS